MTRIIDMNPSECAETVEALLPFEHVADYWRGSPDGHVIMAMGTSGQRYEVTVGDFRTLQSLYRRLMKLERPA